jgi:hypothetical protein
MITILGANVNPARWFRQCSLMPAALLLVGCGLSDYEGRMLKSQTYVENKDREDQILGLPLVPPPKLTAEGKRTDQPVMDLYIRPPRGINSQYDANQVSDIMWRYPAAGGPGAANCPFTAMYLAVSTTMDRDQFWTEVQTPFMPVDLTTITKVTKTPIDGPALEFESDSRTVEERGSSQSYFMYVYRKDLPDQKVARVAIVFCSPEKVGIGAAATEAMEMCLKTLSVGGGPRRRGR